MECNLNAIELDWDGIIEQLKRESNCGILAMRGNI